MRTNRNNQPSFTVPVAAFHAADVPPFVDPAGGHAYAYPSDGVGRRVDVDDARYATVRFGARVGRMIAATPTADRNAVIVATVAAARRVRSRMAGRNRVGADAFVVATGVGVADADNPRAIADAVVALRRALRNPATRAAVARRMIADAADTRTADVPDAADTSATADADA